ncbi:MAG: hypothetical protein D6800_00005, partial [Candidatus Zixiibacteriota bacterium]
VACREHEGVRTCSGSPTGSTADELNLQGMLPPDDTDRRHLSFPFRGCRYYFAGAMKTKVRAKAKTGQTV